MINKIKKHTAIILFCFSFLSPSSVYPLARKSVVKTAKRYTKKAGHVAWHTGQTIVGGAFSYLTITWSIMPEIKDKTFFKDNENKVSTAGMAIVTITCLKDGLQGLDHELKIHAFIKKVLKKVFRS